MSILRLQGVVREIGDFVILAGIDAAIALGDRIGLVGPNGAGKTTLMRIAAGIEEPDRGTVQRKRGLSLGLLAQEAHLDERFMAAGSLREAVRHGAADLERLERELGELEHSGLAGEARYAELRGRFDALGGYDLDVRVDATLSGLGFPRSAWDRPPTALSGGQQTRAALARLVVADPDLLLLDEPTNHLDLAALEWLEERLRRRSGSLLVASHDRAFLDATATRIWELRDRRLTAFRGDYSAYKRQRDERDARADKESGSQAAAIERERELVQRYRSHRKYSKMHEHEARLERLEVDRREAPRRARRLALPTQALAGGAPVRSGEMVVRLEDLAVGYLPGRAVERTAEVGDDVAVAGDDAPAAGGREVGPGAPVPSVVARAPFIAAARGERIGIVGPNGAGKTTLLRTIAGELPPLDGSLVFGHQVQLGYLAQLRGAAIPGATVLEAVLDALPVTPGEARGYLARFLFRGDDVFKEVRTLSGGERSRLEMALLGILPANLLLLDEPTNHLDIPAREAIETFLHEAPATILLVSHDRRLLDTVCERLWVVADGLVVPFDGTYREWRAAVADGWTPADAAEREASRLRPQARRVDRRPAAEGGGRGKAAADAGPVAARAAGGPAGAGSATGADTAPIRPRVRRAKLSKDAYRRRSAALESELTRLGLRKNHLELALGDPAVQANFVELRRVTSELADVDVALAAAEEAWLELEEQAP
jgi:ATP-binding cassette subfamily F protein 3